MSLGGETAKIKAKFNAILTHDASHSKPNVMNRKSKLNACFFIESGGFSPFSVGNTFRVPSASVGVFWILCAIPGIPTNEGGLVLITKQPEKHF